MLLRQVLGKCNFTLEKVTHKFVHRPKDSLPHKRSFRVTPTNNIVQSLGKRESVTNAKCALVVWNIKAFVHHICYEEPKIRRSSPYNVRSMYSQKWLPFFDWGSHNQKRGSHPEKHVRCVRLIRLLIEHTYNLPQNLAFHMSQAREILLALVC
jgi:hypothetical protein